MPAALNHLIVMIPGMAGSELIDPTLPLDEQRVWYSHRRSIVTAVVDPDRLAIDRPLVAVGLLQKFTVVPWWKSIDGYSTAWSTVASTFPNAPTDLGHPDGPTPNAQIVAYPYDFRLGVAAAADRLAAFLGPRFTALGDRTTVVIVGHSMGGLVARRWASHHDPEGRCRGILTLGTPFRGAPKALDVLVNGLYWGSRLVQRRKLSAVVQSWPGLHDLLPIDDRIVDDSGRACGAWELADLPMLNAVTSARETHVGTRDWWAADRPRPALLTVSGYGHATRSTATWTAGRLTAIKAGLTGERDGDGTVPVFSAVPPEWSGASATNSIRPCGDHHGAISHTGQLREFLLLLNSGNPPPTRGAGEDVFLGFDVDELVEPGDVITGTLRFNDETVGARNPDGTVAVTSTLCGEDGREHTLQVGLGAADEFVIQLPAGVEGVVRLDAKLDRGFTRRRSQEYVVVLGAAE
jgi:pimeloyl-ACP methyl ester carboxylesterase